MTGIIRIGIDIEAERVVRNVIVYRDGYTIVSAFEPRDATEEIALVDRVIAAAALAAGWDFDPTPPQRAQRRPSGGGAAYAAICAVIDRVKTDDRHLDTDEYAGMIVEALGGIEPPDEYEGE